MNGDYTNIALARFVSALRGQPFLVLDTETTGLHRGEICQIAILNHEGNILLNTLVKPMNSIPMDAYGVHGISDEMVQDAPTWAEIAPQVLDIISNQNLVVYNATYDRKMMHQSGEAAGMPRIEWKEHARWYCAMIAFAEHYGDWNDYHGNYRWQKLSTAAIMSGMDTNGAHDALVDCLMTLHVVHKLLKVVT